ncbi:MAG: hypothetical protein HKP12_02140 [Gammaproteobacteria bacterium]|nr:hypothetical protein [Gammaproteobacteria bacterium]
MKAGRIAFVAVAIFTGWTLTAVAGTQAVREVEVIKGDNVEKHVEVITFDDTRFRIDFLGPDMKRTDESPYIMTVDNGESWVLGSKPKKQFYCSSMQTEEFFKNIGSQVTDAIDFFNVKADSPVVKQTLEEPGPEIQGFKTTHVRVETNARAYAKFLFVKFEYTVKIVDDLWYTTDVEIHPIRKKWIHALMRSDNQIIDNLFADYTKNLGGPVLKSESVVDITNVRKKKTDTQKERTELTSVKELTSEELDKIFQMPKCEPMDDDDVKDNAQGLLSAGKLTL